MTKNIIISQGSILSGFTEIEGYLWVTDKEKCEQRKQKPETIAYENDFYLWKQIRKMNRMFWKKLSVSLSQWQLM